MEIIYIEGNAIAFKKFIDEHYFAVPRRAELAGIEGKNRWVITREDGNKYIARPWETNPDAK